MDKTKLSTTWLMLIEELDNIINSKEYFLLDKILEKYNIKEEDYIWGISRDYKMDFHNYIFIFHIQKNQYICKMETIYPFLFFWHMCFLLIFQ